MFCFLLTNEKKIYNQIHSINVMVVVVKLVLLLVIIRQGGREAKTVFGASEITFFTLMMCR